MYGSKTQQSEGWHSILANVNYDAASVLGTSNVNFTSAFSNEDMIAYGVSGKHLMLKNIFSAL